VRWLSVSRISLRCMLATCSAFMIQVLRFRPIMLKVVPCRVTPLFGVKRRDVAALACLFKYELTGARLVIDINGTKAGESSIYTS
jgi:hypothetical protein